MVTLFRFREFEDMTHGLLYINNKFVCFTLEDVIAFDGYNKIAGRTRISSGLYSLVLRDFGGFYKRYTEKYEWHREMIEVSKVHGFTDILWHQGNSAAETQGCILLGMGISSSGLLLNSAVAYKTAYELVYPRLKRGDETHFLVSDQMLLI
jgi:hypothetical protein